MLLLLTACGVIAPDAAAQVARVGDVTRLQGQGRNVLVGYGLVTGLQGTGDGDRFRPTMDALSAMIARFGADVASPKDIANAKNVAIVMLEVVLPEHGAREGDLVDVAVTAVAGKSLAGGRLIATPLIYHDRSVEGLFGFAQGRIVVSGEIETHGVIRNGARIERDVFMHVVVSGAEIRAAGIGSPWIAGDETYITLVLDDVHAGWSMAAAVAQAVDKELGVSSTVERLALAVDSKNVVVLVPRHQRGDPASWIRDVEQTPLLMESNEARVTINRNAGTIVITGDTRLSPVIVSQKGLTITVLAPNEDGTVPQAVITQADFVPVDVAADRQANVKDLLQALNRLKVPFEERVSILEEIHRAGNLHAKMVYEG
jgi:flagellar P-ring protein precursor FlgI